MVFPVLAGVNSPSPNDVHATLVVYLESSGIVASFFLAPCLEDLDKVVSHRWCFQGAEREQRLKAALEKIMAGV